MRKPMCVVPATMLLAALIVGLPCPSQAVICPPSVPMSADNLISMKDLGAIPNQGTALDIAPLFNCALTFAKSQRVRAIYFGWGDYTFLTPPQTINFPITIAGDGKGRTQLIRGYTASSRSEGLLTFVAGSSSSSVRDLGIVAASGTFHGSAISLISSAQAAPSPFANMSPDFSFFTNLYLSAVTGGNWDVTVYANGTARTSEPIGLRDVDFQNCSVFGAAEGALWLEGVVAFNFFGGGIFQAGGFPGTSGKILISPSYNGTGFPSYYVNVNTTFVDGILMQASEDGHFSALFTAPITTSSFSVDNIVIGHVDGGVQPFWQKSKYIDPEN
jgi:hypothetical protein